MRLFLFTLAGEIYALRAEEVLEVLPAAGAGLSPARLPGLGVPAAPGAVLRIATGAGPEERLAVDLAGGLVEVRDDEILPLPGYLFPPGEQPCRGLFRCGDRLAALMSIPPRPGGASGA